MSTDRDTTRIVRSWLEKGVTALPDRILDDVLDQLPATPQRRVSWLARRFPEMNNTAKVAFAAAAVVVVALLGMSYLMPSNVGGPGMGDPTPSPTSITPSPTSISAAVIPNLEPQVVLDSVGTNEYQCSEPQPSTAQLREWTCTHSGVLDWDLTFRVASESAVHSVRATVTGLDGGPEDLRQAASFLAHIAEAVNSIRAADTTPMAVGDWIKQKYEWPEDIHLQASGVTYTLGGPSHTRWLRIVATP